MCCLIYRLSNAIVFRHVRQRGFHNVCNSFPQPGLHSPDVVLLLGTGFACCRLSCSWSPLFVPVPAQTCSWYLAACLVPLGVAPGTWLLALYRAESLLVPVLGCLPCTVRSCSWYLAACLVPSGVASGTWLIALCRLEPWRTLPRATF